MNKIIKRTVFLIFAALIAVVLFKDTEVQGNVKIYSGGKNIHRGDRRKRIQDLKEIRLKEVQASLKDKKNQRDLTVIVEGNKVKLSSPIVFSYNRYYFSIDELLSLYGYKVKKAENMVYINSNDNKITINLKERLININGKVEPLRGEVEMVEGKVYASLLIYAE
ncbi:stalk domain-containing protein [Clostridium polynesiense]|uniref:stalk domain-containing protein n=1 Tax=Clostridium polynesiense TaxID=1325933 RepID=UPI00058C9195|nr:stalk domain-containing protein [Clostridium polynesiense]